MNDNSPTKPRLNRRDGVFVSTDPAVRLWSRSRLTTTGCWEYQGGRNQKGYGIAWFNGKCVLAHRLAYLLVHGPFDESLSVCHHCDNPCCVYPEHLFLGTISDNAKDMMKKGRQNFQRSPETRPRGMRNGTAKLSDDKVREMRSLYDGGLRSLKDLSQRFLVSRNVVYRVVTRKGWAHVK